MQSFFHQAPSLLMLRPCCMPCGAPLVNRCGLQVFTAGGYFREAASMFQDMQAGGVELTEETYMLLMLACGEGGLSADAGEIYR